MSDTYVIISVQFLPGVDVGPLEVVDAEEVDLFELEVTSVKLSKK